MAEVFLVTLSSDECSWTLLMITWADIDHVLCCHMVSLGHIEAMSHSSLNLNIRILDSDFWGDDHMNNGRLAITINWIKKLHLSFIAKTNLDNEPGKNFAWYGNICLSCLKLMPHVCMYEMVRAFSMNLKVRSLSPPLDRETSVSQTSTLSQGYQFMSRKRTVLPVHCWHFKY